MKILIVGSGAREHTLAWAVAKSPDVEKIYVAPGNGGIRNLGSIAECVPISAINIDALLAFAKEKHIDLTIVGPEQPLEHGIANRFHEEKLNIIAPTQQAAQLETSKAFAKQFMQWHKIPTAGFQTFQSHQRAKAFIEQQTVFPIVIKASGLASGKGVVIAEDKVSALKTLEAFFEEKIFGAAADEVVIEEFMQGEEASVFVITDGVNYVVLPTAQDHKRIGDGDTGKNTGGMGAYSPAPIVTPDVMEKVKTRIIEPTLRGMAAEGNLYQGFLYVGLMIEDGDPKVVEFNARLGDPETEVVIPLLEKPLLPILQACAAGALGSIEVNFSSKSAAAVVMASKGYPDGYETGKVITGECHFDDGKCALDVSGEVYVFHAGTKFENGKLYTAGGRVLAVTAVSDTLELAIKDAYEAVSQIHFDGAYYRTDIGAKGLKQRAR
jgi:phosphoribosylamine--glycine ligase